MFDSIYILSKGKCIDSEQSCILWAHKWRRKLRETFVEKMMHEEGYPREAGSSVSLWKQRLNFRGDEKGTEKRKKGSLIGGI